MQKKKQKNINNNHWNKCYNEITRQIKFVSKIIKCTPNFRKTEVLLTSTSITFITIYNLINFVRHSTV